ncbi:MAG TPA: PAS domain-containing protein, partial [Nannocystaceae bacterium]|nr:PAS domain-containing protein [Nannocystaceae bacterium]
MAPPSPQTRSVDIDAVQTGILQIDLDGRVVMTNAESRRLFGTAPEELADFHLLSLEGLVFREDGTPLPAADFP